MKSEMEDLKTWYKPGSLKFFIVKDGKCKLLLDLVMKLENRQFEARFIVYPLLEEYWINRTGNNIINYFYNFQFKWHLNSQYEQIKIIDYYFVKAPLILFAQFESLDDISKIRFKDQNGYSLRMTKYVRPGNSKKKLDELTEDLNDIKKHMNQMTEMIQALHDMFLAKKEFEELKKLNG